MSELLIPRLAIIGVGSIGTSLALALKKAQVVGEVVGCGRSQDNLEVAQQRGAIDRYTLDASEAVQGADVVFLAVPMGSMGAILKQIAPALSETSIVTDGGSSKTSIIQEAEQALRHFNRFVPGHPIAGTERSGAEAGISDLYQDRRVLLTPTPSTDSSATEWVTKMWQAAGATVETMSAEHHDQVLAATSHLPHMLAFGLVDSLARMDDVDEIFRYAAGGFRDFTRIASSDPVMWRDICLNNRDALLDAMQRYVKDVRDIYKAVDEADGDTLLEIFQRAKTTRDKFCN
ncbi:Prephenate dehydrogenase [gamma proteobacterium HTCC5015]|nr:Prephenate dehydrogenase [gamma proteobacterium HTCC5015]